MSASNCRARRIYSALKVATIRATAASVVAALQACEPAGADRLIETHGLQIAHEPSHVADVGAHRTDDRGPLHRRSRDDHAALDAPAISGVDELLHDPPRALERQAGRIGEPGDADGPAHFVREDPAGAGDAATLVGVDERGDIGGVDRLHEQSRADVAEGVDQQLEGAQHVLGAEPRHDPRDRGVFGFHCAVDRALLASSTDKLRSPSGRQAMIAARCPDRQSESNPEKR